MSSTVKGTTSKTAHRLRALSFFLLWIVQGGKQNAALRRETPPRAVEMYDLPWEKRLSAWGPEYIFFSVCVCVCGYFFFDTTRRSVDAKCSFLEAALPMHNVEKGTAQKCLSIQSLISLKFLYRGSSYVFTNTREPTLLDEGKRCTL